MVVVGVQGGKIGVEIAHIVNTGNAVSIKQAQRASWDGENIVL